MADELLTAAEIAGLRRVLSRRLNADPGYIGYGGTQRFLEEFVPHLRALLDIAARAEQAEAERDALRAALEPFAEFAVLLEDGYRDDGYIRHYVANAPSPPILASKLNSGTAPAHRRVGGWQAGTVSGIVTSYYPRSGSSFNSAATLARAGRSTRSGKLYGRTSVSGLLS